MSELLSRDELAAVLHVHPRQVTEWANAGRIPTAVLLPNGKRLYDPEEVRAALAPRPETRRPATVVGTGGYVSPLDKLRGGQDAPRTKKKTGSRG